MTQTAARSDCSTRHHQAAVPPTRRVHRQALTGRLRPVTTGAFVRQQSQFRDRPEGGPERHHLYVALACPWSQRAAIVRAVTGLEIGITYAHPYRDERGWAFTGGRFTDELNGFEFLEQAYDATDPSYDGRVSRPRPVGQAGRPDRQQRVRRHRRDLRRVGRRRPLPARTSAPRSTSSTSGSTASSRTASTAPASPAHRRPTTRPSAASSPRWTGWRRSSRDRRYLAGDEITLADWRLLPTLLRFDAVYHTHFRCNGRRLIEYPNLLRYTTDLYEQPHVAETFALDEIKRHYYTTHDELNPKRIIPPGRSTSGFT